MPNRTKELIGLFTSEPLVAAAWDGRPAYRLAQAVTESDDRRELIVDLRRDVRFHTGDLITAPVVRDLLVGKLKFSRRRSRRSRRSAITSWCSACTSRRRCGPRI